MAGPASQPNPVGPDTLITIKIIHQGSNRRFKLPLKDLGASTFPLKLRSLLAIPDEAEAIFERYSDSAAAYVLLDSENPSVYKQLFRAAKAKLKLKIRATVPEVAPPSHKTGDNVGTTFCIDCNYCGSVIPNQHYHCGICENGDYDLCQACVDKGVLCPGEDHWLIKRALNNGVLVTSTTETVAPKTPAQPVDKHDDAEQEAHGQDEGPWAERTCRVCFQDLDDANAVTCEVCEAYDLCFDCVLEDKHGHHPGHRFVSVQEESEQDGPKRLFLGLCEPGRERLHAAFCDGCDERIIGVRHKCLGCPDWDYCGRCIKEASTNHPGHRFAPIYENLSELSRTPVTHYGVFCDGPLCQPLAHGQRTYIKGTRYKCAVCNDTDFCERCEAHPTNTHNITHPLVKFTTPVRHVSVTTYGENKAGKVLPPMGDHSPSLAIRTTTDSASQASEEPMTEKNTAAEHDIELGGAHAIASGKDLEAFYVREIVPDGTQVAPNTTVEQTWTLYNPGPHHWPKGCRLEWVGGDRLFNIPNNHPSSMSDLASAMQSEELTEPLPPLKYADFTVKLRTPDREGKAISYWRLRAPDNKSFGHQLWCDIDVRAETKIETVEPKEVENTVEAEGKTEDYESGVDNSMVFPKLERESPASSTHEAQSSGGKDIADTENNDPQLDLIEDVESLTLDGQSTEDEFLTDEEYDILDASDQEFNNTTENAEKK